MKIEEDTLESLGRFVQSRQQNKLPRVPHEDYYVAAVVDFQPLAIGDILTKVRWNVDQYVEIISDCQKYVSLNTRKLYVVSNMSILSTTAFNRWLI